jgi:outer membrane protein TolC
MQSSNPLVVVGISAVVLLGAASTSHAQSESPIDADSARSSNVSANSLAVASAQSPQKQAIDSSSSSEERSLASSAPSDAKVARQTQPRATAIAVPETNHVPRSTPSTPSIATPSIKIFIGADTEALASQVAQVSSEEDLDTPESSSNPEAAEPETAGADEEPRTLPEVNPANAIEAPASMNDEVDPADSTNVTTPLEDAVPAPESDVPQDPTSESSQAPAPMPPANNAQPGAVEEVETDEVETDEVETGAESGESAPEEVEAEEVEAEEVENEEESTPPPDASTETEETEPIAPAPNQAPLTPPEQSDEIEQELEELDEEPQQEEAEEAEEIESSEDDGLVQPSDPSSVPEYLDPDANPLSFPTTPEEVELVGTQPLTLEQAIELAIRNNTELQTTRLELQRLQAVLREAEANNYPTVDLNTNLSYSAAESARPGTATEQIQVGTDASGQPQFIEQEVQTDSADGTDVQRTLGLEGGLQVSYALYTSGRRPALIESAERQVRFQELQVEAETEDLILQITSAYYDLQEADEEVQIFRASLEEAERSLRDAEALERAGVGTRFDVLQAQVDAANALQNLRNQQSDQEIARRQLAERLNLNQTVTLAAADPIEVAGVWELSLEETIVAAYRNRAELEQQLVQREINERNRRAALAQLGPQVTVSTGYNLSNTLASDPQSIAEDVGFVSSFQAQLGLSMPLYDGGVARSQARQAEANIAIAEANFANQRDQIRFDVEQAYSQLNSNFENIQTTALAVQQAIESLRLARLRFQAGVGTQNEVLQAQTALTQARFNNLQAILNYNRALASLQRQVSNLPGGALNDTP